MRYNLRKRGREPVTDTGEDNTQDVDGDGIGPAPAKRVKDSKSKLARKTTTTPLPPIPRVRRKGSLQDLPKMPLDIIDEVSHAIFLTATDDSDRSYNPDNYTDPHLYASG